MTLPRAHQTALRKAMAYDTDPRWRDQPVTDPRSGTTLPPVPPYRRTQRWLWAMIGVCIVIIAGISIARAAEPATRPHVITVYFAGKDYEAVSRTHLVLGDITYESKETCRVAIVRVRVEVKGARLRCDPVEQGRVR